MRDLYARLGVSQRASTAEISAAVRACSNASVTRDARAVLLDADRRVQYDRVLLTLKRIGRLRSELGLLHAAGWSPAAPDDFEPKTAPQGSAIAGLQEKLRPKSRKPREVAGMGLAGWAGIVLVTAVLGLVATQEPGGRGAASLATDPNGPSASERGAAPAPPAQPLPASGVPRRFSSGKPLAPLEIRTSAGHHYFVKLVDTATGQAALDVFVVGGETVEVGVPLGNYEMRYASGEQWFGHERLFGVDTTYSKAESVFRFARDARGVSGYTVTLYRVTNGNLRTSRLSSSEF